MKEKCWTVCVCVRVFACVLSAMKEWPCPDRRSPHFILERLSIIVQLATYWHTHTHTKCTQGHAHPHSISQTCIQRIAYHCSLSAPILLCCALTHVRQIAEFMDLILPPILDRRRAYNVCFSGWNMCARLLSASHLQVAFSRMQRDSFFFFFLSFLAFPKGKLNIEHTAFFFQQ